MVTYTEVQFFRGHGVDQNM